MAAAKDGNLVSVWFSLTDVRRRIRRHFATGRGQLPPLGLPHEGVERALERGSLRLVNGDDGHLAVEPCGENRTERRAQARKNRPLIEFRHRMARGGSVLRAHAHEV
jgi:hypothetical protein